METAGRFGPMVRQRVRIRFCKLGDLRLIGHRDLMRCMERMFRRAGLKLAMSQGFHPKPRMTFPAALAVGIEGTDEVMELQLAQLYAANQVREMLAPQLPSGLSINSIECLPEGTKKARVRGFTCQVPVPKQHQQQLPARIEQLMAAPSWPLKRARRAEPLDLRPSLEELSLEDNTLRMRLVVGQEGTAGPRDVLEVLGLKGIEAEGVVLRRSSVEVLL
jgi:radical SAM-linked protein